MHLCKTGANGGRYYVWNTATNWWVDGAGTTVESGWEKFDLITAAGDGVLYARKPNGDLFRFQYDVAGQRFTDRDKASGVGWNMFSELTSPGADTIYARGAAGKDPWGEGTVPVLRWYQHHNNVDTWAPGAADGTGKSVGTGWNTEISVSAEPGSCTLRPFS